MATDKFEFETRCRNLRDAKAAVDIYQRTQEKGPLATVTIYVEGTGEAGIEDVAAFDVPVGAINELLSSAVKGVEIAEVLADVLFKGTGGDNSGRQTIVWRGAGDVA